MTEKLLRILGEACVENAQCTSNFCHERRCVAPRGRNDSCCSDRGLDACPGDLRCHEWSRTCQPAGFQVSSPRCAGRGDCPPGRYCKGGICVRRKIGGMACAGTAECVDGYGCHVGLGVCLRLCLPVGLQGRGGEEEEEEQAAGDDGCPEGQLCKGDGFCSTPTDVPAYRPDRSFRLGREYSLIPFAIGLVILGVLLFFFKILLSQWREQRQRNEIRRRLTVGHDDSLLSRYASLNQSRYHQGSRSSVPHNYHQHPPVSIGVAPPPPSPPPPSYYYASSPLREVTTVAAADNGSPPGPIYPHMPYK